MEMEKIMGAQPKSLMVAMALSLSTSASFATEVENTRPAMADVPDAIMCIINTNPVHEYVYHLTAVSKDFIVRYDGPNNNLLHYSLPSGQPFPNGNPQPANADCVTQGYSLQQLIQKGRAFKSLTPMPSGRLLN